MKKFHDAEDENLLAGRKPVLEALEASPDKVEAVFLQKGLRAKALSDIANLCRKAGVRFRQAEKRELDKLFPGNHQGVVAQVMARGFVEEEELADMALSAPMPLVIALDQVQDPGNVGAMARTLYAMGGAGFLVPRHGGARIGAGAYRASSGALDKLPVARTVNMGRALEYFDRVGFTLYCASTHGQADNALTIPLKLPAVLVLGNEEKGVRPGVAQRCHKNLSLPMLRDFDSLNVAQAGAIFIARFVQGKE